MYVCVLMERNYRSYIHSAQAAAAFDLHHRKNINMCNHLDLDLEYEN